MSGNGPDLPDAVLDAVRAIHLEIPPSGGEGPDPEVLAEIAQGQYRELGVRERVNAVATLARHPDGGDDPEVYYRLAVDQGTPTEVRLSAAAGLRFLSSDRAESVALELLDVEDGNVVAAAIGTLAVVGGEQSFETLRDRFDSGRGTLGDPSTFDDLLAGRVAFTRAVIGHRNRLPETPQFTVDGTDRQELETPELSGSRVDFAETIRDRTTGPFFGVELGDDALELRIGIDGIPPLILVPDQTVVGAPAEELTAGPSLWGIVLAHAQEIDRYEPDLLAFADSTDQGIDITVARIDGKAIYAGDGSVEDDGIELTLSDTGLVGTSPTRLRLHIDPDGMTLVEGAVDPEGAVTRTPEPLN